MFILFILTIFMFRIPMAMGQGCTTSTFQFGLLPFSGYTNVDTANPVSFLMDSPSYRVPDTCTCGVLFKWHFYAVDSGPLQLQVWSRDTNSLFTLKGENFYTVPAALTGEQIEYYVPIRDRITVRNEYLIGCTYEPEFRVTFLKCNGNKKTPPHTLDQALYSLLRDSLPIPVQRSLKFKYATTSGIIGFDSSTDDNIDVLRKATTTGDLTPGDTFGWQASSVETLNNIQYAFGASVMANTAPAFTNLPRSINIYSTWAAGSLLYQVSVDDVDTDDVSSLSVYINEDSTSYFNYSRTDRRLYLARANIPVGTYTVTFNVDDQCGNTNTGVFTINVLNWAPTFNNLPSFTTISEDVTNEIELYRVQFSDMDNVTLADSVSLTSTPASSNFVIKYYGTDFGNRSIISKQGASYTYSTTQYFKLQLTLTDNAVSTSNGYYFVYVTKNDPPKITNLQSGTHVNVSYETHRNDSRVFAVVATDAENDALSWIYSCSQSTCPFYVDRGGVVYNTHDFIRTYEPGYDIQITVRDTKTDQASTGVLTVLVQDINDRPIISNLPLTNPLVVYENTALGTVVYTVLYRDFDADDTHTIQATFDETWPRSYFNLNLTTGVLTTAHNILDYEDLSIWTSDWTFTMNITVSDGLDWDSASLVIKIGNVNEAPSFHQSKYTLEPPESASVGNSAGSHQMEVNDPDLAVAGLAESHTYKWNCGNNTRYFLMNSAGAVTFSEDFDLDSSDAVFPYDCVVTVTDTGGLTATTTLEIEVQDTNNHDPVFPQTSTYLIIQDPFLTVGRFVGQVTATDADRSEKYGKIYYSFLQVPEQFSESYLYINDLGNIYVNESWPTSLFDYGVTYELIVHAANAVDDSMVRRTATATVSLILPGTTTVYTTTTDRPVKFIEDNRNIAWVSGESALGLGLLLVVFFFAIAYTVQTKRYRWCIPFFRKRFLGFKKMTQREKRDYYRDILLEQLESSDDGSSSSSSSDEMSELSDDFPVDQEAPPVWSNMKNWVPKAAAYDIPRPPLKRDISGLSTRQPGTPASR